MSIYSLLAVAVVMGGLGAYLSEKKRPHAFGRVFNGLSLGAHWSTHCFSLTQEKERRLGQFFFLLQVEVT